MPMDVKNAVEQLSREWANFKAENDRRLKEIAATGRADPLTEEKINRHSEEIGRLQAQLDEVQKRANRVSAAGAAEDERAAAKQAHTKAYGAFLRKGIENGLREMELNAALQVSVDTDGGYAVPEELERTIGTMERQLTPMEAEVSSITVGNEMYEKLLADGMAASGWVGETAARADTNTPTLASFKPSFGELYAKPKATQKMLDDAFFDAEAWLADEVAQKFAQDLDLAIISGDGTNKPKGILAYTLAATGDATRAYGTIEKKHSGTAGVFTGDNLLDLIHLLRPGYRQGAKWAMAGTTVAYARKFKDTTGQYLWQPGLGAGQQATLLGFSIIEDENVPVVAASANAVLFGNFKRAYKLANVRGVRVLRDPFTDKPYVVFYTTKRVGGGVEDTRAVKVLTLAV
jgi:HK97 family phage major capsid protein